MPFQKFSKQDILLFIGVFLLHALLFFLLISLHQDVPPIPPIVLQAELIPPPQSVKETPKEIPKPKEPPQKIKEKPPNPKVLSVAPEKAKPSNTKTNEPPKEITQQKSPEPVKEPTPSTAVATEEKSAPPANKVVTSSSNSDVGVEGGSIKLNQLKMVYKPDTNIFYPRISKDIGEQGVVGVIMYIDESGSVMKTEVIKSSGFNRLDRAAEQLCSRIRFRPYPDETNPSKVSAGISIKFELSH